MDKEFEILEHTADVGIAAYGKDIKEAFASAAKGMFSLITELDDVEETEQKDIELTAPDLESLLVGWLNELIYLFDVENIIFKRIDVIHLSSTSLEARGYGTIVDITRHKIKMGIKAATYHMLEVSECNGSRVQVLFDI